MGGCHIVVYFRDNLFDIRVSQHDELNLFRQHWVEHMVGVRARNRELHKRAILYEVV